MPLFQRFNQRVFHVVLFTFVRELLANAIRTCKDIEKPAFVTLKENETLYLTTPNLSVLRNMSVDCYFEIHSSSSKNRLQLNVPDSVLEAAPFWNCDDHLSVSEENKSFELGYLCGQVLISHFVSFNDVLHLHYHSNDINQTLGFNISFTDFHFPGCPPEWTVYADNCYVLRNGGQSGVSWVNAQDSRLAEGSNLLQIYSADEYAFIAENFTLSEQRAWIGFTDTRREGIFESLFYKDSVWPNPFPDLKENQREKDCVFFDFNVTEGIAYTVADCEEMHPYICRKRQDGLTVMYKTLQYIIERGYDL